MLSLTLLKVRCFEREISLRVKFVASLRNYRRILKVKFKKVYNTYYKISSVRVRNGVQRIKNLLII